MLILNRVLIAMIKAPFGIVWTLVGAATAFSTWSLTRPHAWTRGASGFPCRRRDGGERGNRLRAPLVWGPNKLIARRLAISEKTVKAHLTRVFAQIGVTDRTQAALWARRHKVRPGDT